MTSSSRSRAWRRLRRAICVVLALVATLAWYPAEAQAPLTIKLATLVPEGSTWHKALRLMGEDWARISGGQVKLKIYAGGVAGNETVMVRKMRIGQLHAAALTNLGLMDIEPSAQVVSTPMLIRSYEELDLVMDKMGPEFERRLEESGFKVLSWSDAGWVHLFSKFPLRRPEEAGRLKIFAWEGDPAAVTMYRAGGFKPVVIASTDMIPSLRSGLVDAFPSTPLGALAMQWFALAPNMLDVPWAPLMGATIVSKDVWDAIPANLQTPLIAAARRSGEDYRHEIRRQDRKAVEVMKKYGLTVNSVDEATRAAWERQVIKAYPIVRAQMVPTEIFDRTQAILEAHRSGGP